MKILNCYAGIGGNRKLWGDEHDITAIEINPEIAKIYQDFYPNDKIIVTDAHEYLLQHFKEYDFIWSSPPCPTHSDIRRMAVHAGYRDPLYPDMKLYEEIILLKHFSKCRWVIENVRPYYSPLIRHSVILGRHLFWCNFYINQKLFNDDTRQRDIHSASTIYNFNLQDIKNGNIDKRKILRNLVNPEIGKYILEQSMYTGELFE